MILAKVAAVIDSSTVVINLGQKSGVKSNMRFRLYSEGDMIIDPDTGLELERVIIHKGRGKLISLQEKIAVIEAYKSTGTASLSLSGTFKAEFISPKVGDIAVEIPGI